MHYQSVPKRKARYERSLSPRETAPFGMKADESDTLFKPWAFRNKLLGGT
jgi:hypothetical protein